ncbi:unnamed protein product [Boreogadus saida]
MLGSASPGNMNRPMVERPERSTRAKGQRGNEGESSDMPTAVSNIDNIQPHKVQWKKRSEELQSRINELEEENALLKQQLEQRPSANQGEKMDNTATDPESDTDWSSNSSTDSTDSRSSDTSSSSSDGRKKKRKHKKKNKKKSKKASKMSKNKGLRVTTISDVVKRYRRVLKLIQKGRKMSSAFLKARVSRNAVKDTAAIAELYIAERSVLDEIKGEQRLLHFAKLCQSKIVGELALKIEDLKRKKKLIPFSKKGLKGQE